MGAWTPHPIFGILASAAGLDPGELLGVVNGGLGMVVVVPRDRQDEAVAVARDAGADSMVVGWVSDEPGVRLRWPEERS
jgi:phosphoribosylaminoimidazole (AIR) synthetase